MTSHRRPPRIGAAAVAIGSSSGFKEPLSNQPALPSVWGSLAGGSSSESSGEEAGLSGRGGGGVGGVMCIMREGEDDADGATAAPSSTSSSALTAASGKPTVGATGLAAVGKHTRDILGQQQASVEGEGEEGGGLRLGGARVQGGGRSGAPSASASAAVDLGLLRRTVQAMSAGAAPLAGGIESIPDDLADMRAELRHWQQEFMQKGESGAYRTALLAMA